LNYRLTTFGLPNQTTEQYKTNTNPKEITLTNWVDLKKVFLTIGHSGQLFKTGGKSRDFGLGMPSLFIADVDEGMTLHEAVGTFKDYQHIIYTSKSHQKVKITSSGKHRPACDRFRVVLALDTPINDKDTWTATKHWLECETGLTNDPQVHFWMFFYPGIEIISINPSGIKITPKSVSIWHNENTDCPPWDKYYVDGKGVLARATRTFLQDSAPNGQFNGTLFKAAADARDQLYTKEEFIDFYLRDELKKHQPKGYFDEVDEATIDSAFSRPPTGEVRKIFKPKNPPGRPPKDGSDATDKPPKKIIYFTPEIKQKIIEVMANKFIVEKHPENTIVYEITNPDKKEVRLVQNEDIWDTYFEQERIKEENFLESTHGGRAPGHLKQWKELFRLSLPEHPKPVEPFLLPDEDGFTLCKLNGPFCRGPFPAWEDFLNRLNSPEAFLQWVGSCFDRNNRGRQALWLYGRRGEDGKSTVLTTLRGLFGEAGASLSGNQLKNESRFLFSSFYKKRFVIYPDCKIPSFVRNEIFRNITSSDMVPVEFKGGRQFDARMMLKLAVGCNKKPMPEKRGEADLSRILILEVSPSKITEDNTWEDRLKSEVGHFLYECIDRYEKELKAQGLEKIPVPESSKALLEESADDTEEAFEALCEHIEFNPNAKPYQFIESHKFVTWFQDVAHKYGLQAKDRIRFRDYLEATKGVIGTRIPVNENDTERKRRYYPITDLKQCI
jgi:hypothetical protein